MGLVMNNGGTREVAMSRVPDKEGGVSWTYLAPVDEIVSKESPT